MNYRIFRSQSIMTINDLAQIGSHNKRMKTERLERKTFNEMLNKSKSIVKQMFLFYNILI